MKVSSRNYTSPLLPIPMEFRKRSGAPGSAGARSILRSFGPPIRGSWNLYGIFSTSSPRFGIPVLKEGQDECPGNADDSSRSDGRCRVLDGNVGLHVVQSPELGDCREVRGAPGGRL